MSAIRGRIEPLYRFLGSVRFTILLLCLIAFGSILGTVIRQGAAAEEYLARYSEGTYRFIHVLGLDDVYHAPWFYTLLVLFALNLVFCTVTRLRRFIEQRRGGRLPEEETLLGFSARFIAPDRTAGDLKPMLGRGYCQTLLTEEGMILERGRFSRFGVYMIHGSILLILLGSLVGLVAGHRGFMTLWKGDTKDRITLRGESGKELGLGFAVQCRDFAVSFYPGGEPKDYVSTVDIIDGGRTVMTGEIRVNAPLSYKGFRFYQATYGSSPSFDFTVGAEKVTLRESEVYSKDDLVFMVARFVEKIHDFGPGVLLAYVDAGETKGQWLLKDVVKLKEATMQGQKVRFEEMTQEYYTGLEVSKDPGLWIVWAGFALILFGLYVNFFIFHRKIYLRKTARGVLVAGAASKNKEAFTEEFERLKGRMNGMEP
jgi:cytochrome c biogenesis protein